MCASESALAHARFSARPGRWSRKPVKVAELTTGSGLVGLHLLRLENGSRLVGLDVDPAATETAAGNARLLGLSRRARFVCADLWSDVTLEIVSDLEPSLVVCNPPYVPEPPDRRIDLEAGAGADGTAHLMRTIEIVTSSRPHAMALSWCSLADPGKVLRSAELAGYSLRSLLMVMIADGEYSGQVHAHLRSLPHCYICESENALTAVAPDGSARFAYLLMAGDFSRVETPSTLNGEAADAIELICERFALNGPGSLVNAVAPVPLRTWVLDRWDELMLRAALHGTLAAQGIPA